jgi:hypothetical protein
MSSRRGAEPSPFELSTARRIYSRDVLYIQSEARQDIAFHLPGGQMSEVLPSQKSDLLLVLIRAAVGGQKLIWSGRRDFCRPTGGLVVPVMDQVSRLCSIAVGPDYLIACRSTWASTAWRGSVSRVLICVAWRQVLVLAKTAPYRKPKTQ